MTDASWLARTLVIAVFAASITIFWVRLRKVLGIVQASKPTSDFQLAPLGPRVRRFLSEVMGQSKVVEQRLLPGLAHAFVFWGFCAFALITINHVAAAFGLRFMSPNRGFGEYYFGFVSIWAALVAVSIAGLFIRRFFARPRWLGDISPESGVIAGLIFFLMVTFFAGLYFEDNTRAGVVTWWLHTLTLAAFLPLIPHTKHLHLALSPVTVFLKREGFSRIPPLVGDEDFGLDTGKDVTRIDALQAFTCVECGRCTEHCPAYNTGKVLNPKEIVLGLRNYLKEYGANSEQPLLGKHISEEAAFECTSCGACEFQCPVGIQHLPIIIGLRRGAVNTGKWEDEYGAKLFLNLERNGNSLGFASSERQKFVEKNELPIYDGSQEYCLWLGCMGANDPQGREIVLALARVLRHAGVTFGVLRKEKCTGDPARRLGNDLAVSQVAEQNIETLRSSKVGKMVSICPHCVRTIGTDWREYGGTFEIEHHSELLARIQEKLPTRDAGREKTVFHDPCYLGRYRNIYEEPREVAGRTTDVIDPPRARERSFCCGAGGGQMFLGEEKGKRINIERAEELVGTGAQVIGTACPFCQTMFRDAVGAIANNIGITPPKLLDIAQIAAASLPPAQTPAVTPVPAQPTA
ncbi:MAG TPA: heterodisulfide reductase-related iron-sulfur binding cluster [Bryobacteraceae bacterium]|nr:heterodisulfide reductase-related iron-sulfur binding cluster [Bryobacteraceae bacterium]